MLLQFQFHFVILSKKISDVFIVDLQVGGSHQKLDIFRDLDVLKYMLECTRNDTSLSCWISNTLHTEGFTTACLTISKYGAIVTF